MEDREPTQAESLHRVARETRDAAIARDRIPVDQQARRFQALAAEWERLFRGCESTLEEHKANTATACKRIARALWGSDDFTITLDEAAERVERALAQGPGPVEVVTHRRMFDGVVRDLRQPEAKAGPATLSCLRNAVRDFPEADYSRVYVRADDVVRELLATKAKAGATPEDWRAAVTSGLDGELDDDDSVSTPDQACAAISHVVSRKSEAEGLMREAIERANAAERKAAPVAESHDDEAAREALQRREPDVNVAVAGCGCAACVAADLTHSAKSVRADMLGVRESSRSSRRSDDIRYVRSRVVDVTVEVAGLALDASGGDRDRAWALALLVSGLRR